MKGPVQLATYHTDTQPKEQRHVVLSKNSNGTVNLGDSKGALVIGFCPVSTEAKVGHCVLDSESPIKDAQVGENVQKK